MKTMKLALLATAALVAVSASARADSVADLKAQFENLNVVAVADAPAAGSIDWSMEVRASMDYFVGTDDEDGDLDISARARLAAHGHTETSVGKVGVHIRLESSFDKSPYVSGAEVALTTDTADGAISDVTISNGLNNAVMNVGYGYWNMTDTATLIAGYKGSLSGIGYGQDNATYGNTLGPASMNGDQEQFQIAFASGPMSFGIALEDGNNHDTDGYSDVAVAAEVKYSGDSFSGEISVGYDAADLTTVDDFWIAGMGVGFGLGDMANLEFSAQFDSEDDYNVSALVSVDVSDAAYVEASVGYQDNSEVDNDASTNINVGAYWAPVDQLNIGVQADHTMFEDDSESETTASFVTWFKF